jgi:hypothetical protein
MIWITGSTPPPRLFCFECTPVVSDGVASCRDLYLAKICLFPRILKMCTQRRMSRRWCRMPVASLDRGTTPVDIVTPLQSPLMDDIRCLLAVLSAIGECVL